MRAGASTAQAMANFLGSLGLIFLFAVTCSQMTTARAGNVEHSVTIVNEIENPHLFEIRKGTTVSWIFGTIHSGVSYLSVAKNIQPRLKVARLVYLETANPFYMHLSETDPVEAILQSDLDINDGDELTDKVRARLVEEFGVPDKIANKMRSESCGTFLAALRLRDPDLDLQIYSVARRMGKKILSLDSLELRSNAEQKSGEKIRTASTSRNGCDLVDLFLTIPLKDHDRMWKRQLDRYRSGIEVPSVIASVAVRNAEWITSLTPELAKGGVFAAFGAGHLYGPKGMINMLREQGYEVARVRGQQ